MSTFAIDSGRQEMVTTAVVSAAYEWVQTPDGKRKPSDVQARNDDTGMPLWEVEVSYRAESFGRAHTVTAMVTVGAPEEPKPAPYTHITFDNLQVDIYTNRAGGFSERWSAESIKHFTPEAARKPAGGDAKAVA